RVPEDRVGLAAEESAVLRLLLDALAGGVAGLAALAGRGPARGVGGGEGRQFDGGVGAHQVRRNLVRVDAQGELERVVDDVLRLVEFRVEDVFPAAPAGLDAVGGGDALDAD